MVQTGNPSPTVKVNQRFQVTLPSAVRQQLGIKPGDHLLVHIQDNLLILVASPQNQHLVDHLAGLHRELWTDVDTTTYLETERTSWQD